MTSKLSLVKHLISVVGKKTERDHLLRPLWFPGFLPIAAFAGASRKGPPRRRVEVSTSVWTYRTNISLTLPTMRGDDRFGRLLLMHVSPRDSCLRLAGLFSSSPRDSLQVIVSCLSDTLPNVNRPTFCEHVLALKR